MKRTILIFALAAGLLAGACKKEYIEPEPEELEKRERPLKDYKDPRKREWDSSKVIDIDTSK